MKVQISLIKEANLFSINTKDSYPRVIQTFSTNKLILQSVITREMVIMAKTLFHHQ
jgi:hypothetical protein